MEAFSLTCSSGIINVINILQKHCDIIVATTQCKYTSPALHENSTRFTSDDLLVNVIPRPSDVPHVLKSRGMVVSRRCHVPSSFTT